MHPPHGSPSPEWTSPGASNSIPPSSTPSCFGRLTEALKDQRFGVSPRTSTRSQVILGAWNPGPSTAPSRSTSASPRCCRARRGPHRQRPHRCRSPRRERIAEVPANSALAPIAEEAGHRIQAALDALVNPIDFVDSFSSAGRSRHPNSVRPTRTADCNAGPSMITESYAVREHAEQRVVTPRSLFRTDRTSACFARQRHT